MLLGLSLVLIGGIAVPSTLGATSPASATTVTPGDEAAATPEEVEVEWTSEPAAPEGGEVQAIAPETPGAETPNTEALDAAADADAPIAPATVPSPSSTDAVITVKVGGDRSPDGSVKGLAGVTLGLYEAGSATTASGGSLVLTQGAMGGRHNKDWSWTTCTSDADGDCSFTIPIRAGRAPSVTGVQANTRFWVAQEASPDGWYSNPSMRVGFYGAAPEATWSYRFRTDIALVAGSTYSSTSAMPWNTAAADPDRYFMRNRDDSNEEGGYGLNVTRTTGMWSQSRENPGFPEACGVNIALIVDTSGSLVLSPPGQPNDYSMTASKNAMNTFVDAFKGTSTKMSLFSFSTVSPGAAATNRPSLLPVGTSSEASAFKAQYEEWRAGGGTNWDRGIAAAANAAEKYDIAVVFTDGNPTTNSATPNAGASAANSLRDTDAGIFSANQLKSKETRVVALGVGPALTANSELNLRAISGPTKGADYFRAGTFDEATAALVALANQSCSGDLIVQKKIVPIGGTIADAIPAPAGWEFNATAPSGGVTVLAPTSKTTTAGSDGTVDFKLDYPAPSMAGDVAVRETQQDGYVLFPVKGEKHAECTNLVTDLPVDVTNLGTVTGTDPGFRVNTKASERIKCIIYNQPKPPPGVLEVAKSSDPVTGSEVSPGQTVSYTLTFKNTGGSPVDVNHDDLLVDVLDDADLVGDIVAETPLTAVLNAAGARIEVRGTLEPGTTKTVTYQVMVKDPHPATANGSLGNFVVTAGEEPPTECLPEEPCTVHPVTGSLSWSKVNDGTERLSGSEWLLTPYGADGELNSALAMQVTDCFATGLAQPCTTDFDVDLSEGGFKVAGLALGKYQLVETKAPAGYQLLTEPIDIVVNSNVSFGDIKNTQIVIPGIPLTGGMGSLMFWGTGAGLALLMVAGIWVQRRRVLR